jgi:hypothetical protein
MKRLIYALARRRFTILDIVGVGVISAAFQRDEITGGLVLWILLALVSAWIEVETRGGA